MGLSVYRSSAGSGKTYTLVRAYIKLILKNPGEFRHILAITFTNKAANEMKTRLVSYLHALSIDKDDRGTQEMKVWLADKSGLNPQDVATRAKKALQTILHQYGELAVGTIDSFMHRVVRTFAHDMAIPAGFEVELDAEELCRVVVDNLLERMGEDTQLTNAVVDYIEAQIEDSGNSRVEKLLQTFAQELLNEDARKHAALLSIIEPSQFRDIRTTIRQRRSIYEKRISELASGVIQMATSAGYNETHFYYGSSGVMGWLKKLATRKDLTASPGLNTQKTLDQDKWTSPKYARLASDPVFLDTVRRMKPLISDILEYQQSDGQLYADDILLEGYLLQMTLISHIYQEFRKILLDTGKMPISDFNALVHEKVAGESVPFIYERLGERYRHFMIDEFQDTSLYQWRNLLPLVENGLAQGAEAIILGDGKQSIYRWRNGIVEQFTELPSIYERGDDPVLKERENTLRQHFEELPLNTNYRSVKEIIAFNNALFDSIEKALPLPQQKIYLKHKQETQEKTGKGKVEVITYSIEKNKTDKLEEEQKYVLDIVRQVQAATKSYRGIAILCRTNDDASAFARFLIKNKIPVVSQEAIRLGNSPRVRAVVAAMKYLNDRQQRYNRFALVEALVHAGVIPETLSGALISAGLQYKHQADRLEDFLREHHQELPATWLRLSLVDMVESIHRSFGLDHSADVHLQFLLDQIEKYNRETAEGLPGFLQWWDDKGWKQSAKIPALMDAVNILTIHKAKGLQFPVVICPMLKEKTFKAPAAWIRLDPARYMGLPAAYINMSDKMKNSSWKDAYEDEKKRQYLDHYNLYYVAFTRPEKELYILLPILEPPKDDKQPSIIHLLNTFIAETSLLHQEGMRYHMGDVAWRSQHSDDSPASSGHSFQLSSASWRDRMRIKRVDADSWQHEGEKRALEMGQRVHQVLANIHDAGDLRALEERLKTDGIEETWVTAILQMLAHPDIAPFFAPGQSVRTEADILLPDGHLLRPDRILFLKDSTQVLDYKTGSPHPGHHAQLRQYLDKLEEMGYPGPTGWLVYLKQPLQVVPVQ